MRAAKNKNPERTPKAAKKAVSRFMAANGEVEGPPRSRAGAQLGVGP